MKGLYIVYYHPERKAGLFYSTHERIKHSIPYLDDFKILNIRYYDNWFLSIIKIIFGMKPTKKGEEYFIFDSLKYENIWFRRGVFHSVTPWRKYDKFRLTRILFNESFISKKKIQPIIEIAQNFDFIMAHWVIPNGRIAMKVSSQIQKPFFVTYHGSDINIQLKINRVLRNTIVEVLKKASMNFVVSNALFEQVKNIDDKINVCTSTNGIPESIVLKEEQKLGNKIDPVNVIFIGNLNDIKRADKLPEIIKFIASKTNRKLTFTILGDGKYKAFIEKELKNSNISFFMPGLVPREKVYSYLAIANILLLPSRNEGMPLVLLEAIATKTIPVASNVGGISEILEEKFIVNESESFSMDFAERVVDLIQHPILPRLEINNYTWELILQKEIEAIKRIIKS